MPFVRRWLIRLAFGVAIVMCTLIVGGAVDARRRHPPLKPWHRIVPDDLRASDMGDGFTFADYQAREARLFAEIEALALTSDADDRTPVNRYFSGSRVRPSLADRDWNRTFVMDPAPRRGGVLLLHGLTDSPYSMRALAGQFRDQGYYTVGLRLPGHGTLPSGLTRATWEDWLAAVRVGARHVREVIGPDAPFVIAGYSNGGALAVKYLLDAIEQRNAPVPSSLILLSPMMGVTPAAGLAWWISRLGMFPYFEAARWIDVVPEYNPFRYNSFAANAGFQTASLTTSVRAQIARAAGAGQMSRFPPVLTFQSTVDATVSTAAVIDVLYNQLPSNGSEVVLFDVNHLSGVDVFLRAEQRTLVARLFDRQVRPYRRALITNANAETRDVVLRTAEAGSIDVASRPLGLAWPVDVFSLTHVAIPFPPDDPLYGLDAPRNDSGLLALGRLSPRGERGVLGVGTDVLMRLSSNPFFPFVAERVREWASAAR